MVDARRGPTLAGLFGRVVGTVKGYTYSKALRNMDFVWTDQTVNDLFELGPDNFVPRSKMPMQQIKRREDRADLIAYLRSATDPQLPKDTN